MTFAMINLLFPRSVAARLQRVAFLVAAIGGFACGADAPTNAPAPKPSAGPAVIRVIAGMIEPIKDEAGNVWKPSEGFDGGQTKERSGIEISNTRIPSIYCSERFGMSKFVQDLPNGKYDVKLHFAVTYEGITGPGQCVLSMDVEGTALKQFDVWKKAGGANRAYVETVPVRVTDGKLDITFTGEGESTTISAIEIVPTP
jgi:endoglucanase